MEDRSMWVAGTRGGDSADVSELVPHPHPLLFVAVDFLAHDNVASQYLLGNVLLPLIRLARLQLPATARR